MSRRTLDALAATNQTMKKLILCAALAALAATQVAAYTITNISIGVDSNSVAWTKVNNNNNNFVGWLNQTTATNNLLAVQQAAIAAGYGLITNELGIFLTSGEMSFDHGRITSDGGGDVVIGGSAAFADNQAEFDSAGNLRLTGGGYVYFQSANQAYLGPATTWGGMWLMVYDGSTYSSSILIGPTFFSQQVRSGQTGPQSSLLYLDQTGIATLNGGPNASCGIWFNADGTITLIDSSGGGEHFDGAGNAAFDGTASFIGGGAALTPDSRGNGGTTLMLNASDTGTPMYLHVDSNGTATWTPSP